MELTFNKVDSKYEAEFELSADANLHVEFKNAASIKLYQRTTGNGWDLVNDVKNAVGKATDVDLTSLIYPKFVKVVCVQEPTYATVTSNGEITEINSQDKEIMVTENGTIEVAPDDGFNYLNRVKVNTYVTTESGDSAGGSGWTGHADAEGLFAIGWTAEDIAYYQANGVNWNEEDDVYHKVSDDNKALYGVLTANNISTYKDRIVYLPKIDTSGRKNMSKMFDSCYALVAIPLLDTSSATNMDSLFKECHSLVCIPKLDTAKVTTMEQMFMNCHSITKIPLLDTTNVTSMEDIFKYCYSLVTIPQLDTQNVISMQSFATSCSSLVSVPYINAINAIDTDYAFQYCYALRAVNIDCGKEVSNTFIFTGTYSLVHLRYKNCRQSTQFNFTPLLSKESLLYLINNEAAASAITVSLHSYAYERLAEDADIVAALSNHPNISLASA